MSSTSSSKITYSSASVDMTEFHARFDAALADVRAKAGQEHSLFIDGEPVKSPLPPIVDLAPADTSLVLGKFASASGELVERAIKGAKAAQKAWAKRPFKERTAILRRAAENIRERKYEIAAVMSLGFAVVWSVSALVRRPIVRSPASRASVSDGATT